MKTFIYICLYICLLVIGLVLPAGAQVPIQSYRGQVSVKQNRIEREGNSLRLDLTISVCGLSVGRYQTLSLMPMLSSDRDSVVMAPVVLNGVNKQKMFARTLVFEGKKAADGDAYTVIKNTPELIREIPYELSIPYQPWMKNAALILVGELDNYEGAPLRTFVNVLTEHLDIP